MTEYGSVDAVLAATAKRAIEYRPLRAIVPADRNPKRHVLDGIKASLRALRVVDVIGVEDGRTGKLVGGHGRTEALAAMRAAGEPAPEGVIDAADLDDWLVPVLVGWASRSDAEADAAVIALNAWTMRAGFDDAVLDDMLAGLAAVDIDAAVLGVDWPVPPPGPVDDPAEHVTFVAHPAVFRCPACGHEWTGDPVG